MLRPKYADLDGYQDIDDNNETPLYLDHFFGGFLILFVGLLISVVIFVTERCCSKKGGKRCTQGANSAPVAENVSHCDIDLITSDVDDVSVKVHNLAQVAFPMENLS